MSPAIAPANGARVGLRDASARTLYLGLFAFSVLVFALYGLHLPLPRDNAIYIYSGQQLLDGIPPYVSVMEQKTPLISFVDAAMLSLSELLFADALIGLRVLSMGVGVATVLAVFALARSVFPNRRGTLLAPLAMIGFHGFVLRAAEGGESHSLLVLLLTGALFFIVKRNWLAAGVASALCVLTWQPAGVVLIVAALWALARPRGERVAALVSLGVGVLAPVGALLAYFYSTGALATLIDDTLRLPVYVRRPTQNEIVNITKSIFLGFPLASWVILAGLPAFFWRIYKEVRLSRAWADNPFMPLGLTAVGFLLWSLVDYQAYPDFFVLLPFAALGIVAAYQALVLDEHAPLRYRGWAYAFAVAALVAIPLLNASFASSLARQTTLWHGALRDQRETYTRVVKSAIGDCVERCKIVVLGIPEMATLLEFTNATRYGVNYAQGIDEFIASHYRNGLAGWLEEMRAAKPDLIVVKMSELRYYNEKNRQLLLDWLDKNFKKFSENKDIRNDAFRSDSIHTWIRKDCRHCPPAQAEGVKPVPKI